MRSHISVHPATTKYFSNSFVLKNKIEKEGLPRDSLAGLGAGGPEFKMPRLVLRLRDNFCARLLPSAVQPVDFFFAVQLQPNRNRPACGICKKLRRIWGCCSKSPN
jgi:hypothetical protein